MTRTPEELPGTPSVDVLSDLLRAVRLPGVVLLRGDLAAPWALRAPPPAELARRLLPGASRLVLLHVMVEGQGWIALDARERVSLPPRSVALLPYADAHVVGVGDAAPPAPITERLRAAPARDGEPAGALAGAGGPTRLICAVVPCDDLLFNPILGTLPPLLIAWPAPGTASSLVDAAIGHLVEETQATRAGGACLRARLVELLVLEVLRGHLAASSPGAPGWLRAIHDPLVGGALQELHARPRERWTVARLARQVGASRSRLGERFTALVGEPPMRYLTRWRLQLAARMLREGEAGLAAIAEQVGYESEAAFNRAFKRHAGAPPGAWRARRGPPAPAIAYAGPGESASRR